MGILWYTGPSASNCHHGDQFGIGKIGRDDDAISPMTITKPTAIASDITRLKRITVYLVMLISSRT